MIFSRSKILTGDYDKDVFIDLIRGRSRRMDAGAEPTGRAKRRIHGVPLSELMNSSQPVIQRLGFIL